MHAYVQLNRKFEDFPEDGADDAKDDYWGLGAGQKMAWPDLLKERFVLIFGEGGVGKTWEMREQAQLLRAVGQIAVFVRFENLLKDSLDAALDHEDRQAYEHWDRTSQEAYFFLDSIDEAKLNAPSAIDTALRKFVRAVSDGGPRVRVFLSCRPSDWRFQTDLASVQSQLQPLVPTTHAESAAMDAGDQSASASTVTQAQSGSDDTPPANVKLVSLCPLDFKQIAILARAYNVHDCSSFIAALRQQNSLFLAERPRDVEWLVTYWNNHARLGSYWEMLEENVRAKLKEQNAVHEGRDPLTPEDTWNASKRLAAATVFCQQRNIHIPEIALDSYPGIDAAALLSDWSVPDVAALLRRPLFDEASAGRVRLHHRTTQGYLTARWLLDLIESGCPVQKVLDVLVRSAYGEFHLVPSMQEIAGWVASTHTDIRKKLVEVAPETVLLFGDPSQIPVEERISALRSLKEKYPEEQRLDLITGDDDYWRIAHPDLDAVVCELLLDPTTSSRVRSILLGITRVGRLRSATKLALKISRDKKQWPGLRRHAVEVVGASGTVQEKEALKAYILRTADLDEMILARAGASLFPDAFSVSDLLSLIGRFPPEDENLVGGSSYVVADDWIEQCPVDQLPAFITGILNFAEEAPRATRASRESPLSERFGWLIHAVVSGARRLIEAAAPLSPVNPLVRALVLAEEVKAGQHHFIHGMDELKKALAAAPVARRAYLQHHIESDEDVWIFFDQSLLAHPTLDDAEAFLAEAIRLASETAGNRLLIGAVNAWATAGRDKPLKDKISDALDRFTLPADHKTWISRTLNPPPTPEAEWQKRDREQREAREVELSTYRDKLRERIQSLRGGASFGDLFRLIRLGRDSDGWSNATWSKANFDYIETRFGADIATATKEGLRAFWPTFSPLVPSSRPNRSTVENGVIVGLAALTLLETEEFDFSRLSSDEARTATLYALREINGFPKWFPGLASAKPDVVKPILLHEVRKQIELSATEARPDIISLSYLSQDQALATLIADGLIEIVRDAATSSSELDRALSVIHAANEIDHSTLTKVARERTRKFWTTDTDLALVWFREWLRLQPNQAWTFLEKKIARSAAGPEQTIFKLMHLIKDDLENRGPTSISYLQNSSLLIRIIPLIFQYLPTRQDLPQRGTFRWGAEEDARQIRGQIAGLLEHIEGQEAHNALQKMARHPALSEVRSSFLTALRRHAGKAVAQTAWQPADIRDFGRLYEHKPRTANELFALACDRLADIERDIKTGDFGDRGIFKSKVREEVLQRYFAGRLRRESRMNYDVTREEEVTGKKKPDIRVRHEGHIVSIEVKPIDKRRHSLPQLRKALKEQLVGQYMKAARANYGILLLCMIEKRKWPQGSFSEIVTQLDKEAAAVSHRRPQIKGLRVIGIDTSPS